MQKVSASKTGHTDRFATLASPTDTLWRRVLAALVLLVGGVLLPALAQAAPVTLKVVSARTEPHWPNGDPSEPAMPKGAPIAAYKYIINIDNTGTTATQRSPAVGTGCNPADAGYPNSCLWTSIGGTQGFAPVFTQGDQGDFDAAMDIPDGRYLISVMADGFKLDGRHFTVSGTKVIWEGKAASDPAGEVKVEMQPWPLPDSQIQAAVFEDTTPVNSAPDLPAEHGLAGFQGHITDYLGEVTTDVYGAPLCDSGRCLSACTVVSGGVDVGVVQPVDAAGRCPTSDTIAANATMSVCNLGGGKTVPPYVISTSATSPFNNLQCPIATGVSEVTPLPIPAGAAIEGKVKIPNIGPNRYALSVTPPDGSGWVQTTTLEGNHDWDAWVMEGATGLDTEFTIGGEPFPAIIFGYVPKPGWPSAVGSPVDSALGGNASISGVVEAVKIYVPTTGGVGGLPGEIWGGMQGAKIDKPIPFPKVTLTDLGNGDNIIWAGEGDENGKFTIPNVPAGTYTLTWWDEPQNTILDLVNVTIAAGENLDMGVLPLTGWWTFFDGYVFNDLNRNGIKDPGEPGLPGYTLTMRKRENSLMDRGTTAATTDADGYYKFEAGYPMTQWLVMEAYDDLHYTTGVTYQADNQPTPTTLLGAGVDVSVHPIIGLSGRMDWGKHVYDPTGRNGIDPRNGGIVGTVTYDVTRNELDPRFAAVEDWQPSIPDLTVKLFRPIACGTNVGAPCDDTGRYELEGNGAFKKSALLNTYLTETWKRPNGCVARGVDGTPLVHGTDEKVLPLTDDKECIEAPLMGIQFWGGDPANAELPGVEVNGNYGFGDGCFVSLTPPTPGVFDPITGTCTSGTLESLPAGDYLVEVEIPTDTKGKAIYKVTREEDINIGNGDTFVPAVPPSQCAGPLHIVDNKDIGLDGWPALIGDGTNGAPIGVTVPGSTPTENATFFGIGGSPYEGFAKPECGTKLISLSNGKSIAPAFNLYTDVPLPGRHWFIIIDDLNFSSNPQSTTFGEKAGMPFVPVGIYDYTNRLVKTVESDYNGLADVLLPSTNRINCPTPSGVCGNLYRYVGNDPGVPGRLNPNYNPTYRTIAAEFEVLPGLIVPADLAPTQVGVTVQLPGGQTTQPVMCKVEDDRPQIFRVDRPYVTTANRTVTVDGAGFGNGGSVLLNDSTNNVTINSWTANRIVFTVGGGATNEPKQVMIVAQNGLSTINGLTLHVLGNGYNPTLYEVSPTTVDASIPANRRFTPSEKLPTAADHAIQSALDAARGNNALVVVYPNNPTLDNPRQNPRGAYYENLIITSNVRLQGVGPGSPDGAVRGTILDGGAFAGDSPVATDWYTRINLETTTDANGNAVPAWGGNTTIYDGAAISLYLPRTGNRAFPGGTGGGATPENPNAAALTAAPMIDGFDIRGGDQAGFPGNINVIGGGPTGQPAGLITQGGAIFANAYANNLRITNNVVQNNGGAYGTIRIGTPDLTGDASSYNKRIAINNNRVIQNAGTNQAGGIGLFAGSDNYLIQGNDVCGNFSSEYGGGISHVGFSPNGVIRANRIYFNRSFDEGGGVMIAGALPANPNTLSPGAGAVTIRDNQIEANLSNDDGGGLRFLMAGTQPMNVYNNFIVNNISTHEGGGISLFDTTNARIYNNTIMGNKTTATAITSNGQPAPAGLSTSQNSTLMAAQPGAGAFSNPIVFNNIFWDNRAGTRTVANVTGLGTTDADHWDLGVADGPQLLAPTNSVVQQSAATHPYTTSASNRTTDPQVISTYDVGVTFNTWRNNPAFLGAILISADLPPSLMGNYHLSGTTSPAANNGAANKVVGVVNVAAPAADIDNQNRPQGAGYDMGADEFLARGDFSVTINDGQISALRNQVLTYTVVVYNNGTSTGTGTLTTSLPTSTLQVGAWTCTGGCATASGNGNLNLVSITLAPKASATVTITATVRNTAGFGTQIQSGATVTDPAGGNAIGTNNQATDTTVVRQPSADLAITIADGVTNPSRGDVLTYTVTVSNNGPDAATAAPVTIQMPASALMGSVSWTCAADCGSTGGNASATNAIATTVNVASGASVTITVTGTVSATAGGRLASTASVAAPANVTDPATGNNSATDADRVLVALPAAVAVVDTFNRANANTLGANWSQAVLLGNAALRVNANQAFANNAGAATWNFGSAPGNTQGAALTFASGNGNQRNNVYLTLKASGAQLLSVYQNSVRVIYSTNNNGEVNVQTTTNFGATYATRGTIAANFANGDTLSAVANADGSVDVWQTTGTTTNYLDRVYIPLTGNGSFPLATGGGRTGIGLPNNARIDNFATGTVN